MSHTELIARYENGVAVLEEALRGLSPDTLDRVPAPGKWTIRQIALHLADSELVVATRLRFTAAEPGCPLPAFDQEKWADTLGYAQQTPAQALALFRAVRHSTVAMLRALPESAWSHTGNHSERGPLTVLQLVESYAGHAEHHARQIRELREGFAVAA